MSIKKEYFDLLTHLGSTSTVAELCASKQGDNIIALRHDVDHDLELALEMAHHEWRLGFKATYYLLHTEKYWNDPKFPLLVRQLKEYGHEVGLHINTLTQWMRAEIDNPEKAIEQSLARIRDCGVDVTGVCAHGDKNCYENAFVNYWMWEELQPDNPANSENGISAEGIYVDDPAYQIPYPLNHELVREDGTTFPLWSISMEKHGLKYDAAKLNHDQYWSDSGGAWVRTGDPTQADCSTGRHQVLVHPWWWRGPTKTIFVMSPARSGSKRLANYIEKASSAVGLHDWTLNHVREGNNFICDNKTHDVASLLEDPQDISSRLRAARAHHSLLKRDVVECSTHLEAVTEQLVKNIPDSIFVYLCRKPEDIVRLLLLDGWHEEPSDDTDRSDGSENLLEMTQVQRADRYVRSAVESITLIAQTKIVFEEMVANPDYLPSVLSELEIVVHPLLAEKNEVGFNA